MKKGIHHIFLTKKKCVMCELKKSEKKFVNKVGHKSQSYIRQGTRGREHPYVAICEGDQREPLHMGMTHTHLS